MMVADLALKAAEPARRLEFVVELEQSSAMSFIYMWPADDKALKSCPGPQE